MQRFGSKRELLLKIAGQFSGSTAEMFAQLRTEHQSPLAAIRAYADCMAGMAATPESLFRNLSYLQIDLTDPETAIGDPPADPSNSASASFGLTGSDNLDELGQLGEAGQLRQPDGPRLCDACRTARTVDRERNGLPFRQVAAHLRVAAPPREYGMS